MKFIPLSESSITVDFGNTISPEINDLVLNLAAYFEKNRFEGFIETVPAYCSLTIFYDLVRVRKSFPDYPTAFEAVKILVKNALPKLDNVLEQERDLIKIPVEFDLENKFDLGFVAATHNLNAKEVIEIFTAQTYRVYMIGFLPGFAYMGEVDEKIATGRRTVPRSVVPKGSVGIAGKQTAIYPLESPGGWQIIGKTDIELFTPFADEPTFLQPGDLVKFYPK